MIEKYVLNNFPYWIYGENKIASHDKLYEWFLYLLILKRRQFYGNININCVLICIFTDYFF